jgi:ethanolamine ammonia-lyase small subunit
MRRCCDDERDRLLEGCAMSRTRQLMAELAAARGAAEPMPPPPPIPPPPRPPARVYAASPEPTATARLAAAHTTALVGIGHVGTRYATEVALQFQAELAVAHAAVATELPDDWAAKHDLLPLRSRVQNHREFLLRPDLGRRLDEASLAVLRQRADRNPDVQLIIADGLSAVACMATGKPLYAAVAAACAQRGLRIGTPVCAKFARVWLEDEIGQEVGAKVAIILLGERPGLGTGDGLSAYAVYQPRIGKTDGDRNMMSNLHPRGTSVEEAAPRLAALAAAMITQRRSGVNLDLGELGAFVSGYRAPQVRHRLVEHGEGAKR